MSAPGSVPRHDGRCLYEPDTEKQPSLLPWHCNWSPIIPQMGQVYPTTQSPEEILSQELAPGERLLWQGTPAGGLLSQADCFLVPFSIMWGGFAIFWESAGLAGHAPVFFDLWGLPFVAMGLYFIAGRFWVKARSRQRTIYAVTDRRVIEIGWAFRKSVRSLALNHLPALELSTRAGGRGRIVFGSLGGFAGYYANTGMDWLGTAYGGRPLVFFDVPDARGVYETIQRAAAAASPGRS